MKWFNNLSVMTKLIASFVVISLFSGLVGLIGMSNIKSISNDDMMLYQRATVSIIHVGDAAMLYERMRVNLREIFMYRDKENVEKRRKTIDEINRSIRDDLSKYDAARKYGGTSSAESDEHFKEVSSAYDDVYNIIIKIAVIMGDGKEKEAYELLNAPATVSIVKRMDKSIVDVVGYAQSVASKLAEDNSKAASRSMLIMTITIGVSIFIAIAFGYMISVLIKRPIAKGLEFAKQIADGDFTNRIDLDQNDELGKLGKALNTAADDLEKMVADIVVGSQNLVQAIQEISAGNENLSQRTSEQASSLEEVASTIEETSASINQNAENAKRANDLSVKTSAMAEEGGRVVYEAVSAINEINEASKKIEEIISVINEIAFQTNLLALNAAVEAARAGEQGRGFAVVAGEVRNLAQRSGNAAKEIGELIKATLVKVDKGTTLSNKSGESLKEIIASVKQVNRLVSEIDAASEEQRQGSAQINIAVSELDSATQQNAGLVEETASASEEIANQAQELLATMERFKIRDNIRTRSHDEKHKEMHLHAAAKASAIKSVAKKPAAAKAAQSAEPAPAAGSGAASGGKIEKILSDEGFEQF